MRRENKSIRLLLFTLPLLYLAALFVVPLIKLFRMSLADSSLSKTTAQGWTLSNFSEVFFDPVILDAMVATFRIGVCVTLLTLFIGYPIALFLTRTRSRWRSVLLALTLAPIFISIVVRSYGWIVLLSKRGLINSILSNLGITSEPLSLIFNEFGIIIGTAHVLLPFMVLSIMGSLQVIEPSLEPAAMSLGARPWRVFRDIVWPLSLPGVTAGVLLVFILSISSFVTPMLLGGQAVMTLPILAFQQFTSFFNWVAGSTIIVFLLICVVIVSAVYERAIRRSVSRMGAA